MQRSYSSAERVVRSRFGKALLLPMQKAQADELGLRNHIALASMRAGQGSLTAAQHLLEAIVLTGFLVEAGFGELEPEQFTAAELAVCEAIEQGSLTGKWLLGSDASRYLEIIVTLYDQQLREAPLSAVVQAGERLRRFKSGLPFGLNRKRGR
ncbi:hypothetical protein AAGS40_29715 (plasmid) [Paraburkholderia sp. PREW-6R]|uniref:hypothetical protein n=1 Tax=Paraburkholderia sp. PREW-6R TaxID=3141544 RepID=UPI0031F5B061